MAKTTSNLNCCIATSNNKYWRKTCIDNINLAIKLHNIKRIVVLEHSNCKAYDTTYNNIRNNEKEYHISNITKCIKMLKRIYPNIIISGFYLDNIQDEKIV